jgi:hypothetical protein
VSLVTHLAYTKKIMFQVFNTQFFFNFSSSIVKTESDFFQLSLTFHCLQS